MTKNIALLAAFTLATALATRAVAQPTDTASNTAIPAIPAIPVAPAQPNAAPPAPVAPAGPVGPRPRDLPPRPDNRNQPAARNDDARLPPRGALDMAVDNLNGLDIGRVHRTAAYNNQTGEETYTWGDLDQTSPEAVVRTFVSALNNRNVRAAARCVYGGTVGDRFSQVQAKLTPPKPTFELLISDIETLPKSRLPDMRDGDTGSTMERYDPDAAIVTLALTDMVQEGHAPGTPYPLTVERLQLIRSDGRWYVQAPAAGDNDPFVVPAEDTLAYYASLMVDPETLTMLKGKLDLAACQKNLARLGLASAQYLQDYDETLKMTPDDFEQQLRPYLVSSRIFHCPLDAANSSYSFNPNLAGVALANIPNPDQVVLFYEGHNGKLDFRHQGLAGVCYVDGHVGVVNEGAADALRWKP